MDIQNKIKNEKLISVIIPVYNIEKYIFKCLSSVASQKYTNLEIIVVDDGSTDNSGEICDMFAAGDNRIKIIHQKNAGLSAARNAGIDASKGEYIGFIDGDDYIDKMMYYEMIHIIEQNDADMVICDYESVDENGNVLTKQAYLNEKIISGKEGLELLQVKGWADYVVVFNKLYKRKLFNDLRFVTGIINEDTEIAHKIFSKCKKIAITDKRFCYYVKRKGSITNSALSVRNLDVIEALCNRFEFYEKNDYTEFLNDTFVIIRDLYEIRKYIATSTHNDKNRIKEIDKMVKAVYNSRYVSKTFKNTLLVCFPEMYFGIKKLTNR